MRRHRTTARGIAFLTVIFGLCAGGAAAAPRKAVPKLIFQVVGGGPVPASDDPGVITFTTEKP